MMSVPACRKKRPAFSVAKLITVLGVILIVVLIITGPFSTITTMIRNTINKYIPLLQQNLGVVIEIQMCEDPRSQTTRHMWIWEDNDNFYVLDNPQLPLEFLAGEQSSFQIGSDILNSGDKIFKLELSTLPDLGTQKQIRAGIVVRANRAYLLNDASRIADWAIKGVKMYLPSQLSNTNCKLEGELQDAFYDLVVLQQSDMFCRVKLEDDACVKSWKIIGPERTYLTVTYETDPNNPDPKGDGLWLSWDSPTNHKGITDSFTFTENDLRPTSPPRRCIVEVSNVQSSKPNEGNLIISTIKSTSGTGCGTCTGTNCP